MINDHISLFWNKYGLKGMSLRVYGYHVTKKGKKTEGVDATLAKDLLPNTINETIDLK
jgi:hypothetical protein